MSETPDRAALVAEVRQRAQRELRSALLSAARRLCNAASDAQSCVDAAMVERIRATEVVVYEITDDLLGLTESA